MGQKILSDLNDRLPAPPSDPNDPDLKQFLAFARTFILPLIVFKVFILYFGLNYSQYPGEGYGYGLAATLVLSALSFAYFLWSQRGRS